MRAMDAPAKIGLRSPRFWSLLLAQFLGAANDNAFKVTLVLLILATVSGESTQVLYSSLAAACFPIPFLLFSPIAGYFADRFPKHRVLFWTKSPEIMAMGLATFAFASASVPLLFVALFLMATHSAFFSPAKYGIFPEVFENEDLSFANGILELATNLAILSGSIAGVYVYSLFKGHLASAGLTYVGVAAGRYDGGRVRAPRPCRQSAMPASSGRSLPPSRATGAKCARAVFSATRCSASPTSGSSARCFSP